MLKYIVPSFVVIAGVAVFSISSYAKPEYVKTTKKNCAYCHVDAKKTPKDLTDAGKFYQKNKTLDGYVEKK
jgi:hypothetical protein